MEEAVRVALLEAGEVLAEAMRTRLAAEGLSGELQVEHSGGRVRVVSGSADVHAAEVGCRTAAPTAPLEAAARAASRGVLDILRTRLEEALR